MTPTTRRVVETYLDSIGTTLWGRSFDIIGNREQAIQFIGDLFEDLTVAEFFLDTEHDNWSPDGKVPYA